MHLEPIFGFVVNGAPNRLPVWVLAPAIANTLLVHHLLQTRKWVLGAHVFTPRAHGKYQGWKGGERANIIEHVLLYSITHVAGAAHDHHAQDFLITNPLRRPGLVHGAHQRHLLSSEVLG